MQRVTETDVIRLGLETCGTGEYESSPKFFPQVRDVNTFSYLIFLMLLIDAILSFRGADRVNMMCGSLMLKLVYLFL